jgi:predicted dehydrogenase
MDTDMKPYRAAIVGTGAIASSHVNALRAHATRVQLVAAMDVNAERVAAFAAANGLDRSYTDVAEMLAVEKPDIVHICTPPGTHRDLIVAALEAGAWVLCEKPLCASLAEMDLIETAEQRTGNFCSSVFQWRFGSGGQYLRQLIEAGALGRPLVANILTTWYRGPAYYAVPWRGKWATEVGGVTMGHGIHAIDFLLWLYGDWQEVRAMMGTLVHSIEVEDVSMAMVRFANGAMGNITNSVLSPREESYLRFDFADATVEVTHLYGYTNADWRYFLRAGNESASYVPDAAKRSAGGGPDAPGAIPEDVPVSHAAQLAQFLDAMDQGTRPPVSGPDVRPTLEFLTSLYKAAFTGQPVLRGSIVPGDPFYTSMAGR